MLPIVRAHHQRRTPATSKAHSGAIGTTKCYVLNGKTEWQNGQNGSKLVLTPFCPFNQGRIYGSGRTCELSFLASQADRLGWASALWDGACAGGHRNRLPE